MEWIYDGQPVKAADLDKYTGFVYTIKNLKTGRRYIGKKLLKHRKTKQVKGKKKRTLVESDWREYYGSNKQLLEDVEKLGEKNFERTILKWCSTKGAASYWELYYQMTSHVLFDENYYNEFVGAKIHSRHIKNAKTT
jgi:hypothetical protein